MSDFERIPVTVIEIDQSRCALTFSQGACPATGEPCYQTIETCKAIDSYTPDDPLTLRFSMADRVGAFDEYVIPSVAGVKTDPTRINIGGRRGRSKPLGVRSQAVVTFTDHPHSDILVDPYVDQRSYNPLERSTFWAKWLKRNPYYNSRACRVREGFAGQSLSEMQTRHYVIDRIEGPDSNGRVTLRAEDILRLADDDKAKAPALSTGVLLTDITESSTSMVVTRAALDDYTQYGTKAVRLSDEIIRYASITELSSGNLEFNGLVRGSDGTDAESHDAEDTVQSCLEYTNESPWIVAYELLTEYGNVPSRFINLTDWQNEGQTFLAGFEVSRLITEPQGITDLLGELTEQCLFYIWWDEITQEIRLKAVAPSFGSVPLLTERSSLIADSVKIRVEPDQRASEVWVSFLPRIATEIDDKRKNYRRTTARIDTDAASDLQYGERRIYEVFSPWLTRDAQVGQLSFRLLARYLNPPKYIQFELDIKDRDIRLGESFDIEYRGFVDASGNIERLRYDLISKHEPRSGERIKCTAQKSDFEVGELFGSWMVNNAPGYNAATEIERLQGLWWSDNNGEIDGEKGYTWL